MKLLVNSLNFLPSWGLGFIYYYQLGQLGLVQMVCALIQAVLQAYKGLSFLGCELNSIVVIKGPLFLGNAANACIKKE